MGDQVIAERPFDSYTVDGIDVTVVKLIWRDAQGVSFDVVLSEAPGAYLTTESFDHPPSEEELEKVVERLVTCKFCQRPTPSGTAHLHQGAWVGDQCCWDERLRSSE